MSRTSVVDDVPERTGGGTPARSPGALVARGGRALFVARSLDYGGAERQLVELLKGLHRRGRDVAVVVFYPGGPLEEDLRAAGVPIVSLQKRGRWDIVGFLANLVRETRRQRPAVLHGYMDVPNIAVALLRPVVRGTRVVWGFRASDMDLDRYGWLSRVGFRLERLLSRVPDLIIVNSRAGVEHRVQNGFSRRRMCLIPNGIDVERFRPDAEAGDRLRAEWGIPQAHRLVGLVGRLDPMKDHRTFLAAAAEVLCTRDDVHFVCVGSGAAAYTEALQRSSDAMRLGDRLIWSPPRRDVAAVYNALDVLCLASVFGEGFPNVLGEALACGTPCVGTDVGDVAHIIGDPARVVPPGDATSLARAILGALEAEGRGAAARTESRQRIVDEFSTLHLLERTEAALWPKG